MYVSWRAREEQGQIAEVERKRSRYESLLPDEVEAIKEFALRHVKTGYRKLTYLMLDQDIACASESEVYSRGCIPSNRRGPISGGIRI